ncbi:hypothetical protein CO046_05125 [Candidatus Peregrinibacteria bacterium CG_4_9_14_0_2_um_filter_53_11]|nr:MAG: hypothetical protein CO046_05125 [Candidatus Peregrinibacteria bacterium CG_4_9_14_0_2_um_filter_53_11]
MGDNRIHNGGAADQLIEQQPLEADNTTSVEDEPRDSELTLETAEEARETAEMRTKLTSKREGADISLEVLESAARTRHFDVQTPRQIADIPLDDRETPENKQAFRERWSSFFITSTALLARLFEERPELAGRFDSASSMGSLGRAAQEAGLALHPAEIALITKCEQLAASPTSKASVYSAERWPQIAAISKKIASEVGTMRSALPPTPGAHSPERPTDSPSSRQEGPSFWKQHPVITGLAFAAGAYGVYRIAKGILGSLSDGEKDADGKSEGFFSKLIASKGGWAKILLGGSALSALSTFSAGKLMGVDSVKSFMKEQLGVDVDMNRLTKAMMLASNGDISEAWETIWEGTDEHATEHRAWAEYINRSVHTQVVRGKHIHAIMGMKYSDFVSKTQDWKDQAGLKARETGGPLLQVITDSPEVNKAQMAIRSFLRHSEPMVRQQLLPIREDETTVGEVLNVLMPHLTGTALPSPAAPTSPGAPAQPGLPGSPAPLVAGAAAAAGALGAAESLAGGHSPSAAPALTATPRLDPSKVDYLQRNEVITHLPVSPFKERTLANEAVLGAMMDTTAINDHLKVLDEVITEVQSKIADADEKERPELQQSLTKLIRIRDRILSKLMPNHAVAAQNYLAALASGDEEKLQEALTNYVAAKEEISKAFAESFERDFIKYLAGRLVLNYNKIFKLGAFLRVGDLKEENSKYLFGRYLKKLAAFTHPVAGLRSAAESIRKQPLKPLNEIGVERTKLNGEIESWHKNWSAGTQGGMSHKPDTRFLAEIDEYHGRAVTLQSGLERHWSEAHREMQAAMKRGDRGAVTAQMARLNRVAKEMEDLQVGTIRRDIGTFNILKASFTGQDYNEGVNKLRNGFRSAMEKHNRANNAGGMGRLMPTKGGLAFVAGRIALGSWLMSDEESHWYDSENLKHAALMAAPITGTAMDLKALYTMQDPITGRPLDTKELVATGAFATVGVISDALTVLGVGLGTRAALNAYRTATGLGAVKKAQRLRKAISEGADARNLLRAHRVARAVTMGHRALTVYTVGQLGSQLIELSLEKHDIPDIPAEFKAAIVDPVMSEVGSRLGVNDAVDLYRGQ